MASTTAVNEWAEALARSFLPAKVTTSKSRKAVEHFTKSIKHHNYARTNQFEVQERLIGLEEKLIVLDFDDVSDALRERRVFLGQHHERWLPDALDLLLHLSGDLLKHDALEKLSRLDRSVPVIPTLKWSDIEGNEPINRKDRLWRQPNFGDLSSDEDEIAASTADTSPTSQKQRSPFPSGTDETEVPDSAFAEDKSLSIAKNLNHQNLSSSSRDISTITELQTIRETLFMVQGFPTTLFVSREGTSSTFVNPRLRIPHFSTPDLHSVLQSAIKISVSAGRVRSWVEQKQTVAMMQVLQDHILKLLLLFDRAIAELHSRFLPGADGVASLLAVVDTLRKHAVIIQALDSYITKIEGNDVINCLDILYESVCSLEICGAKSTFHCFLNLFRAAFRVYIISVDDWISHGALSEQNSLFFVQRVPDQHTKSTLWHTWYTSSKVGPARPPSVLAELGDRILAAGKNQAFLRHLGHTCSSDYLSLNLTNIIDSTCDDTTNSLSPFAPTLSTRLDSYMTSLFTASTSILQTHLQHRLGLTSTLSAFSHLYLSSTGSITSLIDTTLFSHIDRSNPSWNDRFLVSDLLESSFSSTPDVENDRIVIHSQSITSRSAMKTARSSVKILENLAIDYILPWPVANIIITDTLASYRRVSLLLQQIRRANYVLEHHALPALQTKTLFTASVRVSAGKFSRPVREAEGVFLILHTFVSTLYTHLTTCVVGPMTSRFQKAVIADGSESGAGAVKTVDEIISLHATYLRKMETACLTIPGGRNVIVCRETIVSVLDLCLQFAFLIAGDGGNGHERSRRDFDIDELIKIKRQARKSVQLLITGLRGVARSANPAMSGGVGGMSESNEANEMLDLLASRLGSCGFGKG